MREEFDPESFDLELLLQITQAKASAISDGHLSIFKFTTHWKVILGTPDIDSGKGREEIRKLKPFFTLKEALIDLLIQESVRCA